jgi:hypothetical protein
VELTIARIGGVGVNMDVKGGGILASGVIAGKE